MDTSYPPGKVLHSTVRLILINGRKANPSGAALISDTYRHKVIDSFEELYERVMSVTRLRQDYGGQAEK